MFSTCPSPPPLFCFLHWLPTEDLKHRGLSTKPKIITKWCEDFNQHYIYIYLFQHYFPVGCKNKWHSGRFWPHWSHHHFSEFRRIGIMPSAKQLCVQSHSLNLDAVLAKRKLAPICDEELSCAKMNTDSNSHKWLLPLLSFLKSARKLNDKYYLCVRALMSCYKAWVT